MKFKQSIPLLNLTADRIPNANDDNTCGFGVGSIWEYAGVMYTCTNSSTGLAVWVNVGGGGGATELSVINRDLDSLEIDSSTGVGTGAVIESATTSLAGLQSAADKTKLNLYPATATNNKYLKGNGTSWVEVDSPVTQTITDGVTTTAPSEDAVFDALALKTDKINNTQNTAVLFWENGIGEDLAGFYYDRTNKILNIKGTAPTIKLLNADGSYSQLDRSQTANTFKLRNYVLQAGGTGKALVLNGTNQYATASGAGLYTNGGAFSCSVWIKTSSTVTAALIEIGTESGQGIGIGLDTGSVKILVSVGSIASGISVSDGNWHHILFCYGSSNISVYIDSILRINYSYALNATAGTLRIGNSTTMFGATTYYNGLVDQVLIYNTKLTAGNATSLYNSGAGNATIPASPTRRYEIEEGSGSVLVDSSTALVNATLLNSPTWTSSGKVPVSGTGIESTLIESADGLTNGERGTHKFGEFNGTTQIQGRFIRGLIDTYYWFITDGVGNVLFDSGNTSTGALPTAKLTVGAPTSLLAGFRFIAGVLNTSSINLGDYNHITSQRTIFKRKGATTANSIWLSESDIHFTQTNSKTVTNTVTATSLIGTIVTGQTLTFPADFWVAGKMEQIEIEGVLSNLITDSLLIDLTLGGTNISTSGANVLGAAFTNTRFKLTLNIKCETVGASGTFLVTGEFRYTTALGTESIWSMTKVGTTTINTTIALALDVKATWGTASASNTITSYNSKGLILN